MPAGGFAAQATVPPVPLMLCTVSVAVTAGPPGWTDACPGATEDRYGTSPSRNDGGASAGSAPHAVFGVPPMVNASVPPVCTNDSGSHALVLSAPLTRRLCT